MKDFYQENEMKLLKEIRKRLPAMRAFIDMHGATETMTQLYQATDSAQERANITFKTTCSEGCSFCCHEKIALSQTETKHLREVLKDVKFNKQLVNRQNSRDFDTLKWVDKKCGLLKDGKCTIYKDRPLVCRTHNSSVEPIDCNAEDGDNGHRQVYILEVQAMQLALFIIDGDNKAFLHEILKEN